MRPWLFEAVRASAATMLGLYAGGVFFVVIAPSAGRLDGPAYVRHWQAMNVDMGRIMPPFLLGCLALLVTACVLSYREGRVVFGLAVAAAVLLVATIVLTLVLLDPVNRLADGWDPDALPGDWADARARWQSVHLARTVLAVAAFVSLLASQVVGRLGAASGT